jgi:hypothetical protein
VFPKIHVGKKRLYCYSATDVKVSIISPFAKESGNNSALDLGAKANDVG